MAKKSFKKGLGSLIQDSRIEDTINDNVESNIDKEEVDKKISWLKIQLEKKDKELKLWRTGKLTIDLFESSLKESNLEYIKKTNSFKKIK